MANFMNALEHGKEMFQRQQALEYMIPFLNYFILDFTEKMKRLGVDSTCRKAYTYQLAWGISICLSKIYDKFFPLSVKPFNVYAEEDRLAHTELDHLFDKEIRAEFKDAIETLLDNLDQFADVDKTYASDRNIREKAEASCWAMLELKGALNATFMPDAL